MAHPIKSNCMHRTCMQRSVNTTVSSSCVSPTLLPFCSTAWPPSPPGEGGCGHQVTNGHADPSADLPKNGDRLMPDYAQGLHSYHFKHSVKLVLVPGLLPLCLAQHGTYWASVLGHVATHMREHTLQGALVRPSGHSPFDLHRLAVWSVEGM